MLKKYKNALFKAVEEAGLDPADFQVQATTSRKCRKLGMTGTGAPEAPVLVMKFRDTPMVFAIKESGESFHVFDYRFTKYAPGFPELVSYSSDIIRLEHVTFDDLVADFRRWLAEDLSEHIKDMSLPDLWSEIEAHRAFLRDTLTPESMSVISEQETTGFSEGERACLRLAIEDFQRLVAETFEPSQEQMRVIGNRLEYLSNALERLNRFDWRGLAISTLLGIAINLTLDTDSGRVLWDLFQQALRSALRLLP